MPEVVPPELIPPQVTGCPGNMKRYASPADFAKACMMDGGQMIGQVCNVMAKSGVLARYILGPDGCITNAPMPPQTPPSLPPPSYKPLDQPPPKMPPPPPPSAFDKKPGMGTVALVGVAAAALLLLR